MAAKMSRKDWAELHPTCQRRGRFLSNLADQAQGAQSRLLTLESPPQRVVSTQWFVNLLPICQQNQEQSVLGQPMPRVLLNWFWTIRQS